jgi:hypothetical protein
MLKGSNKKPNERDQSTKRLVGPTGVLAKNAATKSIHGRFSQRHGI